MTYASTILAESSLVAFWELQETASATADDSKGSRDGGYGGSYTQNQAGPTASTKSVQFANSGYVTYSPSDTLSGAFTTEAWIKTTVANFNCWMGSRSPDYGIDCMLYGAKVHCDIGNGTGWIVTNADQTSGSDLTDNAWHHVVLAASTTGWVVYVDGVSRGSGSYASATPMVWSTSPSRPFRLADNVSGFAFTGYLAFCAIYNTQLNGTQVAAHYAAMTATAPTAPTSLVATAASSSAIDLSWTASTGTGITGYSVERCQGASCSSFSEVGTPTATSFSDTGLTAGTSYSYRVRATSAGGPSSYSSTATAVTEAEPVIGDAVVRRVSAVVTFAGVELEDVISARGQVAADSGWPTCSVFVTAKPPTGNEENDLDVVAGAGNNVTRFVGRVRRFRPSAFPKGIEIVAMGTLAYAAEWAPIEDLLFDETFPSGTTDENLVAWALTSVPGVTYLEANIEGTGITLGTEAPEAFDWRAGTSAWAYIQQLDQATLYRTYQQQDGTIRRVRMIGHPSSTTTSFTLAGEDILEGSTGERNTEQTRNAAVVRGHDYGDGLGPVLGAAYGANAFQGDGTTAATRHPENFSSDLIEDGNDEDGTPLGYGGIDAQDIANAILDDVNKEFVQAQVRSWRDDTHGPGLTCLLDTLDRLAIGEKMWVQGYSWEVDDGWSVTYALSGGGLEQAYTPSPI